MTILFATDLSARATLAGDVAARLASALHENLVVLHVAEQCDDIDMLEREVARLEQRVDAELNVRCGPIVSTIEENAVDRRASYVVVGAQGVTARAALGTVASALAARLPMALWVVRAGERLFPFFDGKRALRVVLPHGRDESFVGARDALIELSRIGPIDAAVVHAPEVDGFVTAERRERIAHELRESVGPVPGVDVRVVVRDGKDSVGERLLAAVREHKADVVVCGTHQRRGVERFLEGSVASTLVRDAPCTVIVAPMARGSA